MFKLKRCLTKIQNSVPQSYHQHFRCPAATRGQWLLQPMRGDRTPPSLRGSSPGRRGPLVWKTAMRDGRTAGQQDGCEGLGSRDPSAPRDQRRAADKMSQRRTLLKRAAPRNCPRPAIKASNLKKKSRNHKCPVSPLERGRRVKNKEQGRGTPSLPGWPRMALWQTVLVGLPHRHRASGRPGETGSLGNTDPISRPSAKDDPAPITCPGGAGSQGGRRASAPFHGIPEPSPGPLVHGAVGEMEAAGEGTGGRGHQ